MKRLQFAFLFLVIFLLAGACSNTTQNDATENENDSATVEQEATEESDNELTTTPDTLGSGTEVKLTEKEYTAVYICPNHCAGSGHDTIGNCPVCGMELMKNPEHQE